MPCGGWNCTIFSRSSWVFQVLLVSLGNQQGTAAQLTACRSSGQAGDSSRSRWRPESGSALFLCPSIHPSSHRGAMSWWWWWWGGLPSNASLSISSQEQGWFFQNYKLTTGICNFLAFLLQTADKLGVSRENGWRAMDEIGTVSRLKKSGIDLRDSCVSWGRALLLGALKTLTL